MARLGLLLLLSLLASCARPGVRAWAYGGRLDLSGDLAANNGPFGGSASADSLGLGEKETTTSVGAELDWSPLYLAFESLQLDLEGSGVVDGNLDFGSSSIPIGEPVSSELELELSQVRAAWNLIPFDLFDLGIGVGLGNFDYRAIVDSQSGPGSFAVEDEQPFAFLTARARKDFGRVEIVGHASGLGYELEDDRVDYLDLEGIVAIRLLNLGPAALRLDLGYRHLDLEVDLDTGGTSVAVDGSISGPFAGLSLRL